ncbi:hypothetical protein NL503_27955, partial [Klebsiella pneumoniae]|nr:hypothetical protein [Klebsiella pneumoniae]
MADTFAHGTKTNALKSQEHNRIKAQSNEEEPTWQNNQDDMEGSFVIKQILQHLASKHGIQLEDLSVREEK